jgi:tRNA modification GTPase
MLLCHDDQTIIAQCTPQGKGAIALLRISGTGAIAIADQMGKLASGKLLVEAPTHTIHYGTIIGTDGAAIDHVLFLLMHGPRTFTGQDVVEITCHNNQFIVETIIACAVAHGARLAQEGEFTKRAVLNNKIDLLQAEAINELINAQTQTALKKSLAQLEGSFSHWLATLESELLKALALSEASFEFIDEELEFAPQILERINTICTTIATIKKAFDQHVQIKQGITVAIIGTVNAGKSSLFNALLGKKRAIVTPIAGTTRDSIEATLSKNGNFWTLIDTAGLRQTDDIVEQEGIKRSFQEAHKADIILLVYDASRSVSEQEQAVYETIATTHANKIITVLNKSDAATGHPSPSGISVSSATLHNISALEHEIEQKITQLFAGLDTPFLLNQRHFNLLLGLEAKLQEITHMLKNIPVRYELLSAHLNDAIASLSELSGKAISEAGMDTVFREFCIGK